MLHPKEEWRVNTFFSFSVFFSPAITSHHFHLLWATPRFITVPRSCRSTCHASYMILLFKPMLFPLPGNLFFCRDIWPKESITSCLPSLCLSPCIFCCCCYCSETSFWNEIFEDGRNVPLLLHRSCWWHGIGVPELPYRTSVILFSRFVSVAWALEF